MKSPNYISIWQWTVFIFAIIILIIFGLCNFQYPNIENYISNNRNNLTFIEINDAINEIENGDIILLTGDTFGEKTCKWYTNDIFSHVGILFRERNPETQEDIIYILESDIGQCSREGVRIISLKDKLNKYKGVKIGGIKKLVIESEGDPLCMVEFPTTFKQKRPEYDDIINLIDTYISMNFDKKIITWWVSEYPKLYNLFKNPNTIFCSELISSIYQNLNIIKKDKLPAFYSPGDFHKGTINFNEGYFLGETKFFNFTEPIL
jgi:hypothetical protein